MHVISEKVKSYLTKNTNSSKDLPYNYKAEMVQKIPCTTNPNKLTDCKVKISLLIQQGIILEARADVFGEPVAVAVGKWLISNIKGFSVEGVDKYRDVDKVREELEIDPHIGGAVITIKALFSAISQYYTDNQK